ncbi:hypothetical protein BHM03_00048396 [Ensete ventricosum]|uniref:Uncharacterized protein n=1 Tax=Ensete ventricosum TaxID=4639 RepID=A0A445ML86_ENSVE|nr:hypothetical protein BHM03_00048396 [Ensete ventricosum]
MHLYGRFGNGFFDTEERSEISGGGGVAVPQMGGNGTVVGVKRVEAGMPSEEWDDSMPLPGDIVKGVAPADDDDEEEEEESPIFASAKTRSEISSVLGRLGRRSDSVWVKVQRGNNLLDLRARVVPYRGRKLYRCFTVMAARDDRHVAVLGDLTLEQCTELQEMSWLKQQGPKHASTVELLQAIRLWFLPGIAEVPLVLAPEEGRTPDAQPSAQGFICISSVFKGSAADRAGLRNLCGDASKTGHLVIISRLQGKGVLPSEASSDGRIVCCDHTSIKERLAAAIEETEEVRLHIMRWPDQRPSSTIVGPPAILLPPAEIDGSTLGHKLGPKSSHLTM